MSETDMYIIRLKGLRWPDNKIASKMGMTEDELEKIWKRIQNEASAILQNGYGTFCDAFSNMALQYQTLGESLKMIATAVGNRATFDDIEKALKALKLDPVLSTAIASELVNTFIILRPFIPITPEEVAARN